MSSGQSQPKPDPFGVIGTVLEGEFEIQTYIAEGGYGVVYKGIRRSTGHPVAIKVLKLGKDLTRAQREKVHKAFVDECQITSRIAIPNIVQAFSTGVITLFDGTTTPWLVLQWIEGVTLRKWLNTRPNPGKMLPRDALDLLRPIFHALGRVHKEQRIAHRDIKPENIMVVENRGQRDLFLVDFGIAKVMQDDEKVGTGLTRTQGGPGFSPRYGAAEQLQLHRSGPWTDVHALALIMTELLTDTRAYSGGDPMAIYAQMLSKERPTPAARGVDVGPWEPIFARALSIDCKERYPDALEFLAALENARPDVGRSPDTVYEATLLEAPGIYASPLRAETPVAEIQPTAPTANVQHYRDSSVQAATSSPVTVNAPQQPKISQQEPVKRPSPNFVAVGLATVALIVIVTTGTVLLTRKGSSGAVVRPSVTRTQHVVTTITTPEQSPSTHSQIQAQPAVSLQTAHTQAITPAQPAAPTVLTVTQTPAPTIPAAVPSMPIHPVQQPSVTRSTTPATHSANVRRATSTSPTQTPPTQTPNQTGRHVD